VSLNARRLSGERDVRTILGKSRIEFPNDLVATTPSRPADQLPILRPLGRERRGIPPSERGVPGLARRADRTLSLAGGR
jgi:hypothetical protein